MAVIVVCKASFSQHVVQLRSHFAIDTEKKYEAISDNVKVLPLKDLNNRPRNSREAFSMPFVRSGPVRYTPAHAPFRGRWGSPAIVPTLDAVQGTAWSAAALASAYIYLVH
jgi:hypothetical protein